MKGDVCFMSFSCIVLVFVFCDWVLGFYFLYLRECFIVSHIDQPSLVIFTLFRFSSLLLFLRKSIVFEPGSHTTFVLYFLKIKNDSRRLGASVPAICAWRGK